MNDPAVKNRHHARHEVRETSLDAYEATTEQGYDEDMAERVLRILKAAGSDGLTDRELLRRVRGERGQAKALKDSVSPARHFLWRRFQVVPTGERSFLPDLETGRPTSSQGERWCAVELATLGQVEAARREWLKKLPFGREEVALARIAVNSAEHGASPVTVSAFFLDRLLKYAQGGVRPQIFDPRALAAGELAQ